MEELLQVIDGVRHVSLARRLSKTYLSRARLRGALHSVFELKGKA